MENGLEVLAVCPPLCATVRRRRAAWLSEPAGEAEADGGVSVTEAVKLKVPKAVGVPVMAPVPVLRLSPVGSEPVARAYR